MFAAKVHTGGGEDLKHQHEGRKPFRKPAVCICR